MKAAATTEKLSNEQSLLLAILKSDKQEGHFLLDKYLPIDWARFLELTHHHRVAPLIYSILQKERRIEVPPMAMKSLAQMCRSITFKMLSLTSEMGQLSSELASKGVRTLMLKGPVLATDLYGDLSLRGSSDLDMLIPMSELERTDALLVKRGYEKLLPLPFVLGDWKWRNHHDIYVHKDKGISVEVHWRLHPGPVKEPGFEHLWERRRVRKFGDQSVHYLGREDLFVYLAYHGARHGWYRLRWLTDIDRLVRQPLDWSRVQSLCRKYGLTPAVGLMLQLAAHFLQTPIAGPMEAVSKTEQVFRLARVPMKYIENTVIVEKESFTRAEEWAFRKYIFSLRSPGQRVLYLLSLLYPSSQDALSLPLPKSLHFLYFVLRPGLLLLRKLRGVEPRWEG